MCAREAQPRREIRLRRVAGAIWAVWVASWWKRGLWKGERGSLRCDPGRAVDGATRRDWLREPRVGHWTPARSWRESRIDFFVLDHCVHNQSRFSCCFLLLQLHCRSTRRRAAHTLAPSRCYCSLTSSLRPVRRPRPDTGDVDGAPSHRSTTAASITRATSSGPTLLLRPPASRFLLHPTIRTHARICCTPARSSPRRRQRPPQFLLSNTFEDSRSAGSFDRESQDHTTASTSPHFARFCLIPLLRI